MTVPTTQRRQRGFTLIELLFVVTLIGIMVAIAVPSFARFIANYRATSAVNDLLQSITQARSEALKQGRRVVILPNDASGSPTLGGSWSNGWTIFSDRNNDQSYNAANGDVIIFTHAKVPTSTTFLGPNGAAASTIFGATNYVLFDGTGYPRVSAATGTLGGIQIADSTGGGTPSVRTLCLALLGRPRIITSATACS
jgi:prepilin-type N-terminal cleavage/methylation domain-containing protein